MSRIAYYVHPHCTDPLPGSPAHWATWWVHQSAGHSYTRLWARHERWLWRAAYLREREARELARLQWLLEQHRRGAEERQAETDEPFPHRARWLDAAADRVAAGEPLEEVMADYGWLRSPPAASPTDTSPSPESAKASPRE